MNAWKERIEERRQKLTKLTDPRLLTVRTNISMRGRLDRQNRLRLKRTAESRAPTSVLTRFRPPKCVCRPST